MKNLLIAFACIIGIVLLIFGSSELGLIHYQFFAPKYANARRKVFEGNQSYVQGKIQDLANYKLQYDTTKDLGNKSAIQAVIRSQFANFNVDDCPEELKTFLTQMRGY